MNRDFWQTPAKKAVSIAVITIGLLFLVSNAKQWWQLKRLKTEKFRLQQQTEASEQENRRLKEIISYTKTDQFIKKEARKLGWGDDNETVVFLPPLSPSSQAKDKVTYLPTSPWQSWRQLFFPL